MANELDPRRQARGAAAVPRDRHSLTLSHHDASLHGLLATFGLQLRLLVERLNLR